MTFAVPYWYDLHAHFRQGAIMPYLVRDHLAMGCAGILAMPNTSPPVAAIHRSESVAGGSLEDYFEALNMAGADAFDTVIIPLYLTQKTTPAMIEEGVKSGLLKACKYYPPHGTTGAEHGAPLDTFIDNGVLKAMEEHGVILCIHGEEHALKGADYFDAAHNAETRFYTQRLPAVVDAFPNLKIVCEHVTTKTAVDFVTNASDKVAATVTPQHILYTMGDLVQGLKYHLYCLPLLKFDADRAAIRTAVTDPANTKFFAGTDSAPHTDKVNDCGCAAGCYTGGIAPQLYAQGFEDAGLDLSQKDAQTIFTRFLSYNGADFYGLKRADKTFTLEKTPQTLQSLAALSKPVVPLPLGLGQETIPWSIKGIAQ